MQAFRCAVLLLLLIGLARAAVDPVPELANLLARTKVDDLPALLLKVDQRLPRDGAMLPVRAWLQAAITADPKRHRELLDLAIDKGSERLAWQARLDRVPLRVAAGEGDAALGDVLALVTSAPDLRWRVAAWQAQAEALVALGRPADAVDTLAQALDAVAHGSTSGGQAEGIDVAALEHQRDALAAQAFAGPDGLAARFAAAERQRGARQWAPALDHYQAVIAATPPFVQQAAARWAAGWCEVNLGRVDQAESRWQAMVIEAPSGPWRGHAMLGLIDVALEDRADPERAANLADILAKAVDEPGERSPDWAGVRRDLLIRRCLLAVLAGDQAAATAHAQAALACGDPRDRVTKDGPGGTYQPPAGVARLIEQLRRGRPLSPPAALTGNRPKAALHVVLGDLAMLAEDFSSADRHFAALAGDAIPASTNQRLYARMRLADVAYAQGRQQDYRTSYLACLDEAPKGPWAPHLLLSLAADAYSRQDNEALAMTRLDLLARKHPTAPEAQSALWFRGVIHFWAERWAEADTAWRDLDQRYPGHAWTDVINGTYRPEIRAHLAAAATPKPKP